jgi:Ca2+-transporting ATPase
LLAHAPSPLVAWDPSTLQLQLRLSVCEKRGIVLPLCLPGTANDSLVFGPSIRAVCHMDEITPVAPPVTRHDIEADKQAAALVTEVRAEEPLPANNFAYTPSQLHKLLKQRTLAALNVFGGLRGLELGLRTDLSTGLSVDESSLDGTINFTEAVAAAQENRPPAISPVDAPSTRPGLTFHLGRSDDVDHFVDRKRVFGANRLPRRRQKSFLKLMWIAFNDKLMILLTIAATISLGIGLYQSLTLNGLTE